MEAENPPVRLRYIRVGSVWWYRTDAAAGRIAMITNLYCTPWTSFRLVEELL